MSVWDSVGTTYVEAATSALPLHRAIVFVAAFMGSLAVRQQTHLSILETLVNVPISEMATISTGPLSKAVLADVLIGVTVASAGWLFSRMVLRGVFALAARSTDLWDRVRVASANLHIDASQPLADRQTAMEMIDASLVEPRARLRSRGAVAELLGGLGVGCLVAALWGNCLDGIVGIALTVLAIGLQVSCVRFFLAEYFGPALLKAQLQGKKPPSLSGVI